SAEPCGGPAGPSWQGWRDRLAERAGRLAGLRPSLAGFEPVARHAHAIGGDRLVLLLDLLLAGEIVAKGQMAVGQVEHRLRHHDAARIGERFKPCRDVDAIAIEIAAVLHDIAEIDAD